MVAATAATAVLALPTPAGAAPEPGSASAVTAELALRVSLLNSAIQVPVDIALNKVQSPAQHSGSVLTATVDGVDQQGPVTLVKADIGKSVTHVDAQGASASVQLVNADVHAPGLPLSTLLGLQALSSEVSCPVDGPPTAKVTAPAQLTVLGKSVTLSLYGSTHVAIPGIGSVDISYSPHTTTSSTAAASALEVSIALNPLQLNVAKVDGTITVASVSCQKPGGPATAPSGSASSAPSSTTAVPGGGGYRRGAGGGHVGGRCRARGLHGQAADRAVARLHRQQWHRNDRGWRRRAARGGRRCALGGPAAPVGGPPPLNSVPPFGPVMSAGTLGE